MKEFDVTITETLKLTVSVEASSKEEAQQMVSDQWHAGDHILDADNFVEVEFESNDGKEISAKRAPGHICAVSTLEAIYKKYGYQVLNRVLRLIIATWEGDSNSFSANIMNAVAKLCVVYKNQLNDETFAEKVGAVSIKQLTRTARERRPGSMGYAEAMILEYNGKKKTSAGKLFMNKLYAKDVSLWIEPDEDDLSEEADEFESLILGQFGDDENMDENNE